MVKKYWPAAVRKAVNACVSLRNWSSLRHRADFLRLQQTGQKWITQAFVIHLARLDNSVSLPEIGFTATKKIGGAVIRNRCKRRLRAACDEVVKSFDLKGYQCVLTARSEVVTREFAVLVKDLRWALRKLDVVEIKDHDQAA